MSTASEKINAALTKGKKASKNMKEAANVVNAKFGNYRKVPGFTDYSVSPDFKELISNKTGKVQQIPAGKKKYLIFNNQGERRSIGMDDIKKLLPETKTSGKRAEAKKETKKSRIVALYEAGKSMKDIAEVTGYKYNSIYVMLRGYITLKHYKELNDGTRTRSAIIKEIETKTGYSKDYIEWRIDNSKQ